MPIQLLASLLILIAFAVFAGGCMRGVTYKIPMPDSLTVGTIKADQDSTLASNGLHPPRTSRLVSTDIAIDTP